jgi:hypothetical protein
VKVTVELLESLGAKVETVPWGGQVWRLDLSNVQLLFYPGKTWKVTSGESEETEYLVEDLQDLLRVTHRLGVSLGRKMLTHKMLETLGLTEWE